MTNHAKHDKEAKENIKRIVAEHGLFIALFEATEYLPSFGYTIGLWKNHKHPELILFGLKTDIIGKILNDAGKMINEGHKFATNELNHDLFESAPATILNVHLESLEDYFGYGIWFNEGHFPALQIVWPDRTGLFPWELSFQKEFTYSQPLLDRNHSFKFFESKDLGVFTTRQHLELAKPIVKVVHDTDGDWQFLTGDQYQEDARLICLEDMVKRDPTLNNIFNLEFGEYAERDEIGGLWKRGKSEEEEWPNKTAYNKR